MTFTPSTKDKCRNCAHFEFLRPQLRNPYQGRCHRPDWPHATTAGKTCPQFSARSRFAPKPTPIEQANSFVWQAVAALAGHEYTHALIALNAASIEIRKELHKRTASHD